MLAEVIIPGPIDERNEPIAKSAQAVDMNDNPHDPGHEPSERESSHVDDRAASAHDTPCAIVAITKWQRMLTCHLPKNVSSGCGPGLDAYLRYHGEGMSI